MTRPTKDEYMMEIARAAATRGTCDRGKSGACIAVDGTVVSTGYVGAARGLAHCDEVGHLMHHVVYEDGTPHEHCVRTAHAEGNALIQAARQVVKGGTIYCKMEPCMRCAVDIINAGIVRVVAEYRYHGAATSRDWLRAAGVELVVLNNEEQPYSRKKPSFNFMEEAFVKSEVVKQCREALNILRTGISSRDFGEVSWDGIREAERMLTEALYAQGEEDGKEGT